jgi:aromatic ring-cleaving dioxygenase
VPTSVAFWHAHVYFDSSGRDSAFRMRGEIEALGIPGVTLGKVNEGPRGPHLAPSYEIGFPSEALARIIPWLVFHHGGHSVLLHPLTADEVSDHSDRAFWLGPRLPLNFAALTPLAKEA